MRTRISLLIPSVALAAALAACGDAGPSKSDFTAKADGSCTPGNTAISSAPKPTNGPQVATSAGTAVTTVDGQVSMLRAMKMPGGDDAAMGRAAVEMQAKVDAAATSAQAYGLTQCGTGLKPAVANLFEGTKSVVKSTYTAKAEGLCRDALRKSQAIAAPTSSNTSTARYLDAQLVVSTKLAADLKAVTAPPGDEATVGEIGAAFDAFNSKLKEMSAAAKANNPRLFGALSDEADVATTGLNAKLDAYGLKTCGTAGLG